MATGCESCKNEDVELFKAQKAAKELAEATGKPYAIYKEQGEFKIIPAITAIEQRYPIIQVLQ